MSYSIFNTTYFILYCIQIYIYIYIFVFVLIFVLCCIDTCIRVHICIGIYIVLILVFIYMFIYTLYCVQVFIPYSVLAQEYYFLRRHINIPRSRHIQTLGCGYRDRFTLPLIIAVLNYYIIGPRARQLSYLSWPLSQSNKVCPTYLQLWPQPF